MNRPHQPGELSRRTGVPIKALRAYTDSGLIYTQGRGRATYRLYDSDALWCIRLIIQLRGLGLALAEIRQLQACSASEDSPLGPSLATRLKTARGRIDARIAELDHTSTRIEAGDPTTGVTDLDPATAVVSIVDPDQVNPQRVRATLCDPQRFFTSTEAASQWLTRYPGMIVLR